MRYIHTPFIKKKGWLRVKICLKIQTNTFSLPNFMNSYEFLRPRGDGKRYLSAPVPKKVKHYGKPGRLSIEAGKGNQTTMEPYRFWSHI